MHSAAGWYLCGAAWSTFSFLFCYAFFYLILEYTSAMVPALNLFLCGLSLGEGWTDTLYVALKGYIVVVVVVDSVILLTEC